MTLQASCCISCWKTISTSVQDIRKAKYTEDVQEEKVEEELKRERPKVKEVGDGPPNLPPPPQPAVSTPIRREIGHLSVRKCRLEAEIQLQWGNHFDLLRDRQEQARREPLRRKLRRTGDRTTATVVRTHRITQLLVIGGTSLSQASMAC